MVLMDQFRGAQVDELMKICFKELEARNRGPPQLILVIKQDKSEESYNDIKRMSDTVLGIPSQCIVSDNVRGAKPQVCANLCLKINTKLGGMNSILRESLPLVDTEPTIIIGADVEHPLRHGPAVVRFCCCFAGSLFSKVCCSCGRAKAFKQYSKRDSTVAPNTAMVFYENTKRKPEHVIYYCDGVSEGEYYDILQAEMRALRMACKMITDDYNPPVTFIIANKRHHMRAFPGHGDGDRKGNAAPGTVIDGGVVDSHRFDFILYGHAGIQGTSVPCHYTVLHNENNMSADDVQRLTYLLGYTNARCTRSVSLATLVYYAQLAARRARLFLKEGSDDTNTINSNFAKANTNIRNRMYHI